MDAKKRKTIWRTVAGIAALTTLAAPLGACGGSSSGAADTSKISENGKDDGATITLWSRAPLERQAKNAAKAYNASHKNQVKVEIIPNDDMEGKVGAASQTDSLPDILAGDVVRVPYWASEGIFADLTKQIDGLSNLEDVAQGHIQAGTVDGKKHVLPFVVDVSVMVWNKDLYKKAGLDPDQGPKSLDQFVEQAQKVAALNEDGVAGSYICGQSGGGLSFQLFPSIWADGEQALNKDGTASLLNSSESQKVFEAYRKVADTKNGMGAGAKEETCATWTTGFENGKIGVQGYAGTGVAALIDAEKSGGVKFGVAPIPGTKEGSSSTYLGGDAMGVSKDSKHVDEAWNFMSWMMTEKAQKTVFADNNDTAANLKTLKNDYGSADPRIKIINDTIATGETPMSPKFNEAYNAAGSPFQIFVQDQLWGDASKLKSDNQAITDILGQ